MPGTVGCKSLASWGGGGTLSCTLHVARYTLHEGATCDNGTVTRYLRAEDRLPVALLLLRATSLLSRSFSGN